MKHLFLFFLPFLFIIISCSDNEPTEPITYTDAELKAKIIGTWSNLYISISYDANGSFQESVNFIYPDSIINQAEVIKGTYDIEDGILKYNINEWNINHAPTNKSINRIPVYKIDAQISYYDLNKEIGHIYPIAAISDSKILINKDLLYFYPLDILTRIRENTNSLWGEWITSRWAIGFDTEKQNYLLGKEEWSYNFNQDSMTVTYGSKLSMDSSAVFHYTTEPLVYNPPDLSWGTNYSKTIEFHNGQIYMFEKLSSTPIPLKKTQ